MLYFQHWVVQRSFGLILFVGEGLGPERLAATRIYFGGADNHLALDSMSHVAFMTNYAKDFATPDSAAAATAIATGTKVNNRSLAMDSDGKRLTSIVELAREKGRAIGLLTDGKLTDPTCAAFYTHSSDPNDIETFARELVEEGKLDVVLGAGSAQFLPATKGGERQDGRDLFMELRQKGFEVVRTRAELESIPAWRHSKLFGSFSDGELAFSNELEERSQQPSLADMVRRSIELLQYNAGGYLLVVDAALMRKAAQQNNGERTLMETGELDRAIAVARRYAGKKSTIIACGDVGIGGMNLNGFPFRKDSGIAILGLNPAGQPWITWAAGPNGTKSYGAAKTAENGPLTDIETEQLEPGAFYSKSAQYTVSDTVACGSGRGAEKIQGSIDNTAIFRILRDEL